MLRYESLILIKIVHSVSILGWTSTVYMYNNGNSCIYKTSRRHGANNLLSAYDEQVLADDILKKIKLKCSRWQTLDIKENLWIYYTAKQKG